MGSCDYSKQYIYSPKGSKVILCHCTLEQAIHIFTKGMESDIMSLYTTASNTYIHQRDGK